MTTQTPTKHHFTPVFYLKAWSIDGRVTRYHRPNGPVVASPIGPKYTGYEDHLYTIQGVSPETQEVLETQFFKPVDSRAAVVHRLLLEGGLNRLTGEQRVDWVRFMMSMQSRNPFGLGELERLADKIMRETLSRDDAEFNAARKSGDPETIYEWTLKYQPHIIANFHKQILPGLIDHEGMGNHLINMNWSTIFTGSASNELLTGDRPFTWTYGWKHPQTILQFPLSPRCLLVATNSTAVTARLVSVPKSALVKQANDQTVGLAVDFVVGTNASHRLFVERRLRRPDQEPIPGPAGKGRPGCPE